MTRPNDVASSPMPTSLLEGVFSLAASQLAVADVRHRSALRALQRFDGPLLAAAIYEAIRRNYDLSHASANKDRSKQNWRWYSPQPQISASNRSPEVIIERAIVTASIALGRTDWSNQVPVASGLVTGARDGRRAIDLVRRLGERHFQLIELKVASDTPLYAAIELLSYACLWLIARRDRPSQPSALLEADQLDLRILAPAGFYARYSLRDVEAAFDEGVRRLGDQQGVSLSFRFAVLDDAFKAGSIPAPELLLDLVGQSVALQHPAI